jgi:hypothetical protein
LLPDGRLDFGKLLGQFAAFWQKDGEILVQGENYHEVAPQLVFMACLQRVVNGGGIVDREYGIGRGRIDVLVRKPYVDADGKPAVQQEAIELKVRRQGEGNPLRDALAQLDGYLSRLELGTGTLIIFDRRPSALRKRPAPEFSRLARFGVATYYRDEAAAILHQEPMLIDWEYGVGAEEMDPGRRDHGFVPGRSCIPFRPAPTRWQSWHEARLRRGRLS